MRDVKGAENIPKEGACIIASNHPRRYDPLMFVISSNRDFHFVADEEIYKNFFRRKYYDWTGCIKTGENNFLSAVKEIYSLLKEEEAIFVFSRGKPEKPLPKTKPGLAKLVLNIFENEGIVIPIIPANIRYDDKICYINFHEPINPINYIEDYKINKISAIEKLTDKVDRMIDLY